MATKGIRRLGCSAAPAVIVGLLAAMRPVNGQRPERRQEVVVPGTGIALNAGWQLRLPENCLFAVPHGWRPNVDGSGAFSPDGSTLSVRTFPITSWAAHKGQIKAAYGRINVLHEDSDKRLWFEFGDPPRVQHYVDVVTGLRVCVGLLDARPATALTADDVRRIVNSIGPAPGHWPPEFK